MATPAKIIDRALPSVVLVGRVNVGKSTLFNRLTESDHAMVSTIPGTTRTRNIGVVQWQGKIFELVDTGGLTFSDRVPLEKNIIEQTETALARAELVLLVIDVQDELLPQEKELAKKISRLGRPVMLIANKADSAEWRSRAYERDWLKLGLGEPRPVSAASGAGLGDLLDEILRQLGKGAKRPKKNTGPKGDRLGKTVIRAAILGRPNVGKSTLFNKLIGEARAIVSPMPHTTREPHDTLVEIEGQNIIFVDTAGIRRKTKVSGDLERQGITKSLEAARRSEIALLLLDASQPIADQDKQLGAWLAEHAKSVIIVVNKWDLAEANDDGFRNDVKRLVYAAFPHLDYAPIVFTSSETEYRIHQIFPLILRAAEERRLEIPKEKIDQFLHFALGRHKPARGKGSRQPKILGMKQIASGPPVFLLTIKQQTSLHQSYVNFLKNLLRESFSFFASPIIIRMTKSKKI